MKKPSLGFLAPLAFWKTLSTQPRIPAQRFVVTNHTLRIYNTKQNLPSVCVCLCACVCADVQRLKREKKKKTGNDFFCSRPDFGGGIVKDSPDAESPTASVSNLVYFSFLLQMIFSHICAHSLTCALFFGWLDLWMNGQKDAGRTERCGAPPELIGHFLVDLVKFLLSMNYAAFWADGRENHMVWVLKQEINVSMLYPMNWKLLNLCMKLQQQLFLVTRRLKKMVAILVKIFQYNSCFGWLLGRRFDSLTAPCPNMHAGEHQSGLHRNTVFIFLAF